MRASKVYVNISHAWMINYVMPYLPQMARAVSGHTLFMFACLLGVLGALSMLFALFLVRTHLLPGSERARFVAAQLPAHRAQHMRCS
eukprot:COSAG05_NODE_1707_length_4242_cov_9.508086_5_plen_87_part_00